MTPVESAFITVVLALHPIVAVPLPSVVTCSECLRKTHAYSEYIPATNQIIMPDGYWDNPQYYRPKLQHEICHAVLDAMGVPHNKQEPTCKDMEER